MACCSCPRTMSPSPASSWSPLPLSSDGLRLEVAAGRTTYKLGDQYADLDATGTANTVEATLSYPIKRTRDDSIYVSLNAANRHLRVHAEPGPFSLRYEAIVDLLDQLTDELADLCWGLTSDR